MYIVAIRHPTQKIDHVSFLEFYKPYLTREKYSLLHSHALLMSTLFGDMYICEELLSRMKQRNSKISSKIYDEQLQNSLRIAVTAIIPNQCISIIRTR